ncbi:MAG: hypothetical protein NT019_02955 [Candidatus Adlerbacteria bacterium]|nr:hypothetical protein [Candidatus Adlerbacteria bacterium]
MNTKSLALYQVYLSRSIALLAGVCALSVFLYGTFLLLAVEHTAARTAIGKQVSETTLQLSTLEAEYLAKTKELTRASAVTLGFTTPVAVAAVFETGDARSLSLRR